MNANYAACQARDATSDVRIGEISTRLSEMSFALDNLESTVMRYLDATVAVRRPNPPQGEKAKDGPPICSSALGQSLGNMEARVAILTSIVATASGCLEI
ncbi:MAG: hypothetical protein JSS14_21920 [Proteobacteria bacterium]|nr:hypothetical protein [Pseudomonadota bacterium]